MLDTEKVHQFHAVFNPAQKIVIVLSKQATFDQAAVALALHTMCESLGKQSSLVGARESLEKVPHFIGSEFFQTQLGSRDLVISFDYVPSSVEKVTSHIDEQRNRFCLVIQPQKNMPAIDPSTIEYSMSGAEADLLILVGVHELEALEELYYGYETFYQNTPSVVIHSFEPEIGVVKIDASGTTCMSESIVSLVQQVQGGVSDDAATNLLAAIEQATKRFSSFSVTADTLDASAWLLRQGARRNMRVVESQDLIVENSTTGTTPNNSFAAALQSKPSKKSAKKQPKLGGLDHQPSNFTPSGG